MKPVVGVCGAEKCHYLKWGGVCPAFDKELALWQK